MSAAQRNTTSAKKQEEKHLKILRDLLSKEHNKVCFDCPSKSPSYVDVTISTFVCARCSGLLREFGHRVKSVYASLFTPQEIEFIQNGGNMAAKEIWLANWNPRSFPIPDISDTSGVRDFMRFKYEHKRWYKDKIQGVTVAPVSLAQVPVSTVPVTQVQSSNLVSSHGSGFMDLLSDFTVPAASIPQTTTDDGFGDFVSSVAASNVSAPTSSTVLSIPSFPNQSAQTLNKQPSFSNFAVFPPPQSQQTNPSTLNFASFPAFPASTESKQSSNNDIFADFQSSSQFQSTQPSLLPQTQQPAFAAFNQNITPVGAASFGNSGHTKVAEDPYAALRGFNTDLAKHSNLFEHDSSKNSNFGGFEPAKTTGLNGFASSVITPPISPMTTNASVMHARKSSMAGKKEDLLGDLDFFK